MQFLPDCKMRRSSHTSQQLAPLNHNCADWDGLCSIHKIRDDEKPLELEMAWICEDSKRLFRHVPEDLVIEAETRAKADLEAAEM